MIGSNQPHPPKPLYPMYPEERKEKKPKPKKVEKRKCLCVCQRTHQSGAGGAGQLAFWSRYGPSYVLVAQGLVSSILCPIMAMMFRNQCPGLPVVFLMLVGRLPLGIVDFIAIFLMSAEAFRWNNSYPWIGKITDKLSWRTVVGFSLALFLVWATILFISTSSRYTDGNPPSNDPKSPLYCHKVLLKFVTVHKVTTLALLGSGIICFLVGSMLLLCVLCIVSRM